LKADPSEQLRLLDLQGLDTRLDQLEHRRHAMPELAEIAALDKELAHLRNLLVATQTQLSDLERERARAESDVEQVRTRVRRDRERMDSGRITHSKELVELSSELESLARRQSVLEDVEFEVMERIEVSSAEQERVGADVAALEEKKAAAVGRRDAVLSEIDGEASLTVAARAAVLRDIAPQLIALYDKVRASSGGLGAAELKQRRCQGCRLELNTVDLSTFRDAAPDEVLRCEECRRILVRTPESGL
jgi:uncharacterized protein